MRLEVFVRKYLVNTLLFILLICTIVYAIIVHEDLLQTQQRLEDVYKKSFNGLYIGLGGINNKLNKLKAVASPAMQAEILLDIWRETGDVQSNVASMPVTYGATEQFNQFLNRTGDYCRQLSKKVARGGSLSGDDFYQLENLIETSGDTLAKLNGYYSNGIQFDEETSFYSADTVTSLDFVNQKYPSLNYDGPFSQSAEGKTPVGLLGNEVTAEEAEQVIRNYIGSGKVASIIRKEDVYGPIECYSFDGNSAYGDYSACVTKASGQLLYFMIHTSGTASAIPTEDRYAELAQKAEEFLLQKTGTQFKANYAQFYGGNAVINLAPLSGDILLYPDLIKVWVNVDDNTITGINCYNYLMNHKLRYIPRPKIAPEDVKLSPYVSVEKVTLTLIPGDNQQELLCYEYLGRIDEEEYLIYINAYTGAEENVLHLIHTNEGVLTM